jgi:hypothetical protein
MKKFSLETIKSVYFSTDFKLPFDDFVKELEAIDKSEKVDEKKKKDDEAKKREVHHVFSELPADYESIDDFLEEKVDEYEWHDTFYDSDGIDDDGADTIEYFKVGDKIFEVDLHCEAEWVGDWSVRKNLPGDVSITDFNEITDFTILEEDENYLLIKLK